MVGTFTASAFVGDSRIMVVWVVASVATPEYATLIVVWPGGT